MDRGYVFAPILRAYRVIVGVQLAAGVRFAREAVIEPERATALAFWPCEVDRRSLSMEDMSEPLGGAMQCLLALE